MIVFQNPGLIDLDAVRTMGVSVKLEGSFGYFGTGLKYAIATILRGGGEISVYRGSRQHRITARAKTIRDREFQIVRLDGRDIGFTTELGRNWEPWMVLRELGCNALDEGGSFARCEADELTLADETTTITVDWPELDAAYEDRDSLFIGDRQALLHTDHLEVRSGSSPYIFYRGVRVAKLEKPSIVTYNILSEQQLTEDRTLASMYGIMGEIRALWIGHDNEATLRRILCAGSNYFESTVDFQQTNRKPSKEFLDAVHAARRRQDQDLSKSAASVYERHLRTGRSEDSVYRRQAEATDSFSQALDAIGLIFSEDPFDLDNQEFVMVETLPDSALTLLEDGRIFVASALLALTRREIASTLLSHLIGLWANSNWPKEVITDLLLPVVLEGSVVTSRRTQSQPMSLSDDSEEMSYSVADAMLASMGQRGEQTPVRIPPPAPEEPF